MFQCTVSGPGLTLWKGTYFDTCPNGRITIRHSQFNGGLETVVGNQTCGTGGSVFWRAIKLMNDSFISELTISVSDDVEGHTVECAHSDGTNVLSVGTIQLVLTSGKVNFMYYAKHPFVYVMM